MMIGLLEAQAIQLVHEQVEREKKTVRQGEEKWRARDSGD
jgi:hypothetical protein